MSSVVNIYIISLCMYYVTQALEKVYFVQKWHTIANIINGQLSLGDQLPDLMES